MVRVKFLVFALVAFGLWALQLSATSPHIAEVSVQQAERAASAARPAFQSRLAEDKLRLQAILAQGAVAWASVPQVVAKTALKGEALTDAFKALRASVQTGLPDTRKSALILALSAAGSNMVAQGDGVPTETLPGLSLKDALQVGLEGAVVQAFDKPYQFFAMQLTPPDRGGVMLVVGAPLLSWELTNGIARETGLSAVGLVQDGKILAADPEKEKSTLTSLALSKAKGSQAVRGGLSPHSWGPLTLPRVGGGDPPRYVASRSALPGTNLEVLGVASVEPAMAALAGAQSFALTSLLALVVLAGVMLVLLKPERTVIKPSKAKVEETEEMAVVKTPEPAPLPVMETGPAPEAHPDDFHFPDSPAPAPSQGFEPWNAREPEEKLQDLPPPVAASDPFSEYEQQTTVAYPADAYASSSGQDEDYNPDATRVATVPAELIQQSAREEAAAAPTNGAAGAEEAHFQTVYKEFVSTRERCGESADGLTYDRFAVKLRKNRDQLVQKYACRTVRFQVYIKDGKAALKATPVRD